MKIVYVIYNPKTNRFWKRSEGRDGVENVATANLYSREKDADYILNKSWRSYLRPEWQVRQVEVSYRLL